MQVPAPRALPVVVGGQWLAAHRDDVVAADVRWYLDGRSGRAAYDAGHLPGAVFVDLDRWLAAPPDASGARHPLPDPAVFAEGMAAAGIGDDTAVVAYDDAGGVIAARLVWMLRATGHAAALLDGGLGAWAGALSTELVAPTAAARFTARQWPATLLATVDDATDPRHVVLDARDHERYAGATEPVDPRAGHIPGARSLPTREHLDAHGHFLPRDVLRQRFQEAGVHPGSSVVAYCGSGVTACHSLLALELAGFAPGRLYPGSWSQYCADSSREARTGDRP
ncbi:sulfurtransferase [Angustibacter sp. Root456]|uniref:sulfurtransferase n=1 Tax=Angustibacter sp. Root456 TaxID=1736539 RepID=UPI0006F1F04F|nr:sulfurtransferase [Angustibacter sp. Root456]KQX70067.1 sulfurtransferase [Angustibacter sp. Root456]